MDVSRALLSIIRVVDAGLVYLDVPSNAKEIVIGVIIVLAAALDVIRRGGVKWLRLPGMQSGQLNTLKLCRKEVK